ncbi:MAG: hypothetical protein P8010_21560 [Desulfosarcinaceae bacterium]|jgi:hypothetical protein
MRTRPDDAVTHRTAILTHKEIDTEWMQGLEPICVDDRYTIVATPSPQEVGEFTCGGSIEFASEFQMQLLAALLMYNFEIQSHDCPQE